MQTRFTRAIATLLIPTLGATGCLSNSYTLTTSELSRLAASPPPTRGGAVRATQTLMGDDIPPSDAPVMQVGTGVPLVVQPYGTGVYGTVRGPTGVWLNVPTATSARRNGISVRSSGGGGGRGGGGGGGGDLGRGGAILVVVAVAVAAAAVFVLAGSEGARYDGWIQLDPSEVVYLHTDNGVIGVPLSELTPQLVATAHRATVYEGREPRFVRLGRAPLNRVGFNLTAGLGFGAIPRLGGLSPETGISGHTFLGFFPLQQFGFGLNTEFTVRNGIIASVGPEVRVFPITYAGVYGGVGFTFGDAAGSSSNNLSGLSVRAGLLGELPITTRLSLQLRVGGSRTRTDWTGVTWAPEASVGLSVY